MLQSIVSLGGTASSISVGKIGHGLMMMTWRTPPASDEEAFEAIKVGIDSLPSGVKMFLNSADFYGHNPPEANLELVARFFEKYPDYADRTFLSVKSTGSPSKEILSRRIDNILDKLRGTKKLDLFECARLVHGVPVEQTVRTLAEFVAQGKFDHIGLSECPAHIVRRANAVFPIAVVEIEVSPWTYTDETKDVIATCQDLDIAVAAYSPLGQGFLSGRWKRFEDLNFSVDDPRRRFHRFQRENFNHNLALVEALNGIAKQNNISTAQLCIVWVASRGSKVVPIPGSSNPTRHLDNLGAGNVVLSEDELDAIDRAIADNTVKGERY